MKDNIFFPVRLVQLEKQQMASRRAEMAEVKSRLRLFRVSCANPPFHITISTDVNILKYVGARQGP